jgi:hypothetical protein
MNTYRLGRFAPPPSHRLLLAIASARSPAQFEAAVRSLLAGPDRDRLPDLFDALPEYSPDRLWVDTVAAALTRLEQRGRRPVLLECQWHDAPGGHLAIAAMDDRVGADVQVGDRVMAGFAAVRDAEGHLVVLPRIFRKVCTNGAIVHEGNAENVLHDEERIEEAIEQCLAGRAFDRSLCLLQHATTVRVDDPLAVLRSAGAVSPPREVFAEFAAGGDRSGYGLVNAATAAARREPDFARRLERERDAARILAALPRGRDRALLRVRVDECAVRDRAEDTVPVG